MQKVCKSVIAHRTPENVAHARTSHTLFRKDFARTRATAHRTCAHPPSQPMPCSNFLLDYAMIFHLRQYLSFVKVKIWNMKKNSLKWIISLFKDNRKSSPWPIGPNYFLSPEILWFIIFLPATSETLMPPGFFPFFLFFCLQDIFSFFFFLPTLPFVLASGARFATI